MAVVPACGPAEATLADMVSLMRTLIREERAAYDGAMAAATRAGGGVDPLAALHHTATFQQHVCKLIELLLGARTRPCVVGLAHMLAEALVRSLGWCAAGYDTCRIFDLWLVQSHLVSGNYPERGG